MSSHWSRFVPLPDEDAETVFRFYQMYIVLFRLGVKYYDTFYSTRTWQWYRNKFLVLRAQDYTTKVVSIINLWYTRFVFRETSAHVKNCFLVSKLTLIWHLDDSFQLDLCRALIVSHRACSIMGACTVLIVSHRHRHCLEIKIKISQFTDNVDPRRNNAMHIVLNTGALSF